MRLQLALNVENIDVATEYYSKLFAAKPHKQRPGYVNFAIENPPLKLVLFENPAAKERLNHLGVEVQKQTELEFATDRLKKSDILAAEQEETVCCHATQNKALSREPQGLSWEWYRITDDEPVMEGTTNGDPCCDQVQGQSEVCWA